MGLLQLKNNWHKLGVPHSGRDHSGTYLKALYTGLYQQTKEQGVKRRTQSMARPKPTPLLGSAQNIAKQEMKLKSKVHAVTKKKDERRG